jgi:pectate lyase
MDKPQERLEIAAVIAGVICAALAMALLLMGCGGGGTGVTAPGPGVDAGGGPGASGGAAGFGAAGAPGGAGSVADGAAAPERAPALDGPASSDGAGALERPASPDAQSSPDGAGAEAGVPAALEPTCTWPTATAEQKVSTTITVSKVYDGAMKRFIGDGPLGTSGQLEGQAPLFQLTNGATLRNVILGSPAADGVHCNGTCLLENVWWEDVGEDAATSTGSSATQVMTIDGGGARHATDKVFQHNGAGTMVIKNFCVQDFGKLYRSCGNCGSQYPRHAVLQNISATLPGSALAGINENYKDTATFTGIFIHGGNLTICQRYTGNNTGAEPVQTGSGADGTFCIYKKSDIVLR